MTNLADKQALQELANEYFLNVESLEQEWAGCKDNYNGVVQAYIDEMIENGDLGEHDFNEAPRTTKTFGFDYENIMKVKEYLEHNYSEPEAEIHISEVSEEEEEFMNAFDIREHLYKEDVELQKLVQACDKQGNYVPEEE